MIFGICCLYFAVYDEISHPQCKRRDISDIVPVTVPIKYMFPCLLHYNTAGQSLSKTFFVLDRAEDLSITDSIILQTWIILMIHARIVLYSALCNSTYIQVYVNMLQFSFFTDMKVKRLMHFFTNQSKSFEHVIFSLTIWSDMSFSVEIIILVRVSFCLFIIWSCLTSLWNNCQISCTSKGVIESNELKNVWAASNVHERKNDYYIFLSRSQSISRDQCERHVRWWSFSLKTHQSRVDHVTFDQDFQLYLISLSWMIKDFLNFVKRMFNLFLCVSASPHFQTS